MQITLSLIMAWLVTTVRLACHSSSSSVRTVTALLEHSSLIWQPRYCLVHPDTGTKTRLMQTSWPHDFFESAPYLVAIRESSRVSQLVNCPLSCLQSHAEVFRGMDTP